MRGDEAEGSVLIGILEADRLRAEPRHGNDAALGAAFWVVLRFRHWLVGGIGYSFRLIGIPVGAIWIGTV